MIDPKFPVSWLPITVPRAPRPLLPLRTHPSHSYNRRYRVERRGQISLQFRVGASYLGMVAQIVTKQKTVLPPGVVSLQNMEVVGPWPGKSLPEEKLARQPGLVLRHVGITQRLTA
jgi:hypothetical protein